MRDDAACGVSRLGSKREQYVIFYASARFWLENRNAILDDQLEIFRRSHRRSPAQLLRRPPGRGPRVHGGATQLDGRVPDGVPHPVRRRVGRPGLPGSRRPADDAEANRLVRWLLDNGVEVRWADADIVWSGTRFPCSPTSSRMQQAFRGFAYTALAAGRISPSGSLPTRRRAPGDTDRLGRGRRGRSRREMPPSTPQRRRSTASTRSRAGVRDGPADWYALDGKRNRRGLRAAPRSAPEAGSTAKSPRLRSRVSLPARRRLGPPLIFPDDSATPSPRGGRGGRRASSSERGPWATPPGTQLDEAPRVAILVDSASPGRNRTRLGRCARSSARTSASSRSPAGRTRSKTPRPIRWRASTSSTTPDRPTPTGNTARARLRAFFERMAATSRRANPRRTSPS